ncbi:MAG: 2-amino-4-hydroxy-6-hydroxymethyldihydropteridine diphosphokinase [Gammaproteobacteria bacterium]|nr:2-amino-4-hydroxy-6-hydroxymethyldihydropteridine diphosphokinase [Gammaproteobacteria bacterium]
MHLRAGLRELTDEFGELIISKVYENPAVGFEGEPFFNCVVHLRSVLTPLELREKLREIQARYGRPHGVPCAGECRLDLDLLLYDDLICDIDGLRLPRRDVLEYAFVLRPLAELSPALKHPETGASMAELWSEMSAHQTALTAVQFEPTEDLT